MTARILGEHDRARDLLGYDCTCTLDERTCEAMVYARRLLEREADAGQLEIGSAPPEPYDPATAPWPEGF